MPEIIVPSILGNIASLLKGKTNPAKRIFFQTFIPPELQQDPLIKSTLSKDWITDGDCQQTLNQIKKDPKGNDVIIEMILSLVNDSPSPTRLDKISKPEYQKITNQIIKTILINIQNLPDIPEELQEKINLLNTDLETEGTDPGEIKTQLKEIINKLDLITDGITDLKLDLKSKFDLIIDQYSNLEEMLEDISEDLANHTKDFEGLQNFLIDKLGNDYEKIKDIWDDYKKGKIGKKELLKRIFISLGPKVIKVVKKFFL